MDNKILRSILLMALVMTVSLEARSFRVAQIPNGSENGCANCHVNSAGGGARNDFGLMVQNSFLDGSGNVQWGPALAEADADGDGYSNGHELQDPFGMWTLGTAAPGTAAFVSFPGSASSLPPVAAQAFSLHFALSGMTPHSGQFFQVRVENSSTGQQVAAAELTAIESEAFDFSFDHVLSMGESYDVEFWSDHSGNGLYDAPPVDHAWRISLSEVTDNQNESFTHNTGFTDIGSPLALSDAPLRPETLVLHANYPNPFNPETTLRFSLDQAQEVSLTVYNLQGQQVSVLFSGKAGAGEHTLHFDARNDQGQLLPAGIYFARLSSAAGVQTQRMSLLK